MIDAELWLQAKADTEGHCGQIHSYFRSDERNAPEPRIGNHFVLDEWKRETRRLWEGRSNTADEYEANHKEAARQIDLAQTKIIGERYAELVADRHKDRVGDLTAEEQKVLSQASITITLAEANTFLDLLSLASMAADITEEAERSQTGCIDVDHEGTEEVMIELYAAHLRRRDWTYRRGSMSLSIKEQVAHARETVLAQLRAPQPIRQIDLLEK